MLGAPAALRWVRTLEMAFQYAKTRLEESLPKPLSHYLESYLEQNMTIAKGNPTRYYPLVQVGAAFGMSCATSSPVAELFEGG